MRDYLAMDRTEIAELDREKTLFVSVVAPLEVHGAHLPVGTDLYVAEGLMNRTVQALTGWEVIRLPDIVLGAQPIPAPGSLKVKGSVLQAALLAWGRSLAELGFLYWMVFDNHGGATHQIAEAAAAIRLKRRRFHLMVPFLTAFQGMTAGDEAIGLPPGRNGDADDAHAGTNETSLMLALSADRVRPNYRQSGLWRPTNRTAMGNLGRSLDQPLLGMAMDWFASPDNPYYVGDPSQACAQAGETMIAYHVMHGLRLLEQAKAGEYKPAMPYGWVVRVISRLFE